MNTYNSDIFHVLLVACYMFVFAGKHKANKGWGALHLASYFGHTEVVKFLIEVLENWVSQNRGMQSQCYYCLTADEWEK